MVFEAVLIAVDLYDEARPAALEVDDVIYERRLPAKVMAECAKLSKLDPELDLLAGHGFAQLAGDLVCHKAPPGRCAATLPFGEG
jgi:hypothetical protein